MIVRTTFARITQESAECGEYAETGWEHECLPEFEGVEEIESWMRSEYYGEFETSCSKFYPGFWVTCYGKTDIFTGESENISFHFEGLSLEQQKELFERFK